MAGNIVYVQGSYVDVHDNEVVNLSIDKATVNGVDINDNRNDNLSDSLNDNLSGAKEGQRSEEQFHFVHPELDEDEAWRIHDAVKRAAAHQRVPEICAYLKELKQKGKVMLPSAPAVMYSELVRLGMPTGEGFSEKHFSNSYTK